MDRRLDLDLDLDLDRTTCLTWDRMLDCTLGRGLYRGLE